MEFRSRPDNIVLTVQLEITLRKARLHRSLAVCCSAIDVARTLIIAACHAAFTVGATVEEVLSACGTPPGG